MMVMRAANRGLLPLISRRSFGSATSTRDLSCLHKSLGRHCHDCFRNLVRVRAAASAALPKRQYHFASSAFASCLDPAGIPDVDTKTLRRQAMDYLQSFDKQKWFDEPVISILNGNELPGGKKVGTLDAFGHVNGNAVQATKQQVDAVIAHIEGFKGIDMHGEAEKDMRHAVRALEAELLRDFAGELIGNQAVDFQKQDGVTEIEESLQANVVEQRLQDQLLHDELAGHVDICRSPAFVSCVSNFSNFLDLCRKVMRNLELGVPVVVLSRSNTTQHNFRWTAEIVARCKKHGIDPSYVTYLCASLEEQQRVLRAAGPTCPIFFTGARQVAKAIKELHPNLVASTGGPNTFVTTQLTPEVEEAIRFSAAIENAGQCTALRHVVAPDCDGSAMDRILSAIPVVHQPREALETGQFAGVFDSTADKQEPTGDEYTTASGAAGLARFVVRDQLPPKGIEEHWRNVVVDVTKPPSEVDVTSDAFLSKLGIWLVDNQPITVAFNGDYDAGRRLWERTGQVVFTVGSLENPALTCQARPQDGEVFGEFPVRKELSDFTTFPVLVPSAAPAYNAAYSKDFLQSQSAALSGDAAAVAAACDSEETAGYLGVLQEYLCDACGPKRGRGTRSTLYGLQTPPLNGQITQVRIGEDGSFDDAVKSVFPFWITNAREQLSLSVHPGNATAVEKCRTAGLDEILVLEDDTAFEQALRHQKPYNVVLAKSKPDSKLSLAGLFVSTLLCVGHVKSTASNDEAFFDEFTPSKKWLSLRK